MQDKKITVAIICGGQSSEHEVSLLSAKNVVSAVNENKYNLLVIGIDISGKYWLQDKSDFLDNSDDPNKISLKKTDQEAVFVSGHQDFNLIVLKSGKKFKIDVIFPVLHGSLGEDGTIQGLFRMMNIPFVGSDVLGSSVGMDKVVAKDLLKANDVLVADYAWTKKDIWIEGSDKIVKELEKDLKYPMFVKPATAGSSVGVNKAKNKKDLLKAINVAFEFDQKVLIEKSINGREIEVSVLGNDKELIASVPGEITPQGKYEFYSYEAKYLDEQGAKLEVPANLEKDIIQEFKKVAKKVFLVLNLHGLSRIDFFLTKDNKIVLNEVNTIPGFTKISMYPKLLMLEGITYEEIINKLIELALERDNERSNKFSRFC